MIVGITCTVVVGLIAIWQARRASHWLLVARILGRDVVIERAKRTAIAMALSDMGEALRRDDAALCARAMRTALHVANDDGEETLRTLGFKLPDRIS